MATLAITAADVKASKFESPETEVFRVPSLFGILPVADTDFTAGQVAYRTTETKYGVADATTGGLINVAVGVFENSGFAGQHCSIVIKDPNFKPGVSDMLIGDVLILGETGAIVNFEDRDTDWYVQIIGRVIATDTIDLDVRGIVIPPRD